MEDEAIIIRDAFRMIEAAIERAEGGDERDVALGEIRRRARQDERSTLEWCRREGIRGFL